MLKTYKYRIYPTDAQKELMAKHFGCCRLVYNLALEAKIEAYRKGVNLSAYKLQKQMTDLRSGYTWLAEICYDSLANSIFNLEGAYLSFFDKRSAFPKFKNKRSANKFYIRQDVKINDGILYIPKFREGIKVVQHRLFEGKIKSCTISKTSTNKYYACLLIYDRMPIPVKAPILLDKVIGIDLGLRTFAVLSDGTTFESANTYRKSQDRLAILQQRASKKKKGSNNRRKAILKVATLHEKIANQRNHFLHNASNEITNQFETICIEDLNVKGMARNPNLSKSISDASWSEFVRQLTYKAEWRGKNLIKIGRFEPTSKTCSNCGSVKDMPLSEREYSCECGLVIDRDLNAAINIRNSGMKRSGAPVELPTLVGAVKQESKFTQRRKIIPSLLPIYHTV